MVILFGAAGSGKSLQGQRLAEKYGWEWFSVGQLLRNRKDPELEAIMLKGELVPDDLVVRMMHEAADEALASGKPNVVLDGYPRDEWQARWLVDNGDVRRIEGAIILKVSHDELWRRLQERGREDDTRESIEKRWGLFEQTIYAMSEILRGAGVRLVEIDGEGTEDEVAGRIEKALEDWGIISIQTEKAE